ncbi:MAG: molybdate ABC transporter substrate-binding protein [Burkholderiales bacterium]
MRAAILLAGFVVLANGVHAQEGVRLYAAGSLKGALTEIADAYTASGGQKVVKTFGPSGLLRQRIANGEPAEVFASANMTHPQALSAAGMSGPVALFARNRLCALTLPAVAVTPETLLERMLDPTVKLGTSTPKADPSGDYAFQLFDKADVVRPGAGKTLAAKALKLTGGPDSPPPPKDRVVYGVLVAKGAADIFLTYCTNALAARKEEPQLAVVQVPENLAVGADYGLTVMKQAGPHARDFALFVLSIPGQEILARHGFTAVAVP